MKDEARPTEDAIELQMRQEFQKQQEYWEQVNKNIKSLSMEELVNAYRSSVNEQRRMALIPDHSKEILFLLQQEHSAAYAKRALQELKSRGLPMAVSLRAGGAWHQSDTDWTETQRQIEQWVDPNQPGGATQPPKDGPVEPRGYRINGKLIHVRKQTWYIINTLWHGKQMKLREFKNRIWVKKPPSDAAFKQAIKCTTKFLTKNATGRSIQQCDGFITLKNDLIPTQG